MTARSSRRQVTITPFWNRMPRFFLYPLTPPGVYVLLGLAFANAFVLDLYRAGAGSALLGLGISFLAGVFAIKYGYDILERTANGHSTPPRLDGETLLEGYGLPFKLVAVVIALMLLGWAVALAFGLGVLVYAVIVAVLLPAIIITLAIERTVSDALNPSTLFGIAFRIGWPYLAVLGLLILLNGGSATVMSVFGQALPAPAQAFLGALSQNFFFFVMMNLMGYLIFQYHDRVGFAPSTLERKDDFWADLLDPVEEDIDNGDYQSASRRLRSLVESYPKYHISLRQRRHQVLKLLDDEDALIDNAANLLAALIDANRMREATEVYIDITDIDPALRPAREGDYEALMPMLVQRGEYRRAVRMANGFHKDFPDSPSIPPLYLEVARIFSDYLDQPDKARQVATFLIKRYPDHPAAKRASALRDVLTD